MEEAIGDRELLQKVEGRVHFEHMPTSQHDTSSSLVRGEHLWDSGSLDPFDIHPAVAEYIRANNLYPAES